MSGGADDEQREALAKWDGADRRVAPGVDLTHVDPFAEQWFTCRVRYRTCPRPDCSYLFPGPVIATKDELAAIGARYARHIRVDHELEDLALQVERYVIHKLPRNP